MRRLVATMGRDANERAASPRSAYSRGVPESRHRVIRLLVVAVVAMVAASSGSVASAVETVQRPPSPDPDNVYTTDHRYYASPWYDGAWQEMIPFGCTRAPYYSRDPSCPRARPGKHHGIDMYMPCGTRLRSAVRGRVVREPNLGTAYGRYGLKIRSGRFDYVIGHARRLLVQPGQRVTRAGHRPVGPAGGTRRLPPALREAPGRRGVHVRREPGALPAPHRVEF